MSSDNNNSSPPLSERTRHRNRRRPVGASGASAAARQAPAPASAGVAANAHPREVQPSPPLGPAAAPAAAPAPAAAGHGGVSVGVPQVSPNPSPPPGRTSPTAPGPSVPEINAAEAAAAAAIDGRNYIAQFGNDDMHDEDPDYNHEAAMAALRESNDAGDPYILQDMRNMEAADNNDLQYQCSLSLDFPNPGSSAVTWHGHVFDRDMLRDFLNHSRGTSSVRRSGQIQCPACQDMVSMGHEPRPPRFLARMIDEARMSYESRNGQRDALAARRAGQERWWW